MKKHYCKIKKIVIDELDGKIINNNHKVIKVSNIPEYVEKNGYKLLKMLSIFTLLCLISLNVYAYDTSQMVKLDLTILTNVYILIAIIILTITLMYIGIKNDLTIFMIMAGLLLLFIGLILIINGFNTILSIIICFIALFIIWLGV